MYQMVKMFGLYIVYFNTSRISKSTAISVSTISPSSVAKLFLVSVVFVISVCSMYNRISQPFEIYI